MKISLPSVLSLLFAIAGAWAVSEAKDWPASTRFFPLAIGVPLLVLSLIQLVIDLKGRAAKAGRAVDFQMSGIETPAARRRAAAMLAWILGFAGAIWLLGFEPAIPLVFFLYLKFQGGESWTLSIGLAAVAYLFFWGLFVHLLHLPLPEARLLV